MISKDLSCGILPYFWIFRMANWLFLPYSRPFTKWPTKYSSPSQKLLYILSNLGNFHWGCWALTHYVWPTPSEVWLWHMVTVPIISWYVQVTPSVCLNTHDCYTQRIPNIASVVFSYISLIYLSHECGLRKTPNQFKKEKMLWSYKSKIISYNQNKIIR